MTILKPSRQRIQTKEQVRVAKMVPTGMDCCGSLKSPDMFEPVMIPVKVKQPLYSDNPDAWKSLKKNFTSILTANNPNVYKQKLCELKVN